MIFCLSVHFPVTFGNVIVHCGPGALESASSSSPTTPPPRPTLLQVVPPTRLPPVRLTDAKNGPGDPTKDSTRPFGGSDSFRVDKRQSVPGGFGFRDSQREGGFGVPDRAFHDPHNPYPHDSQGSQDPRMAVLRPTPAGPIGPILEQTPDSPLRPVTLPTPRRPLNPTMVPEEKMLRLSLRSDPFRQKAMEGTNMRQALQTSNKGNFVCSNWYKIYILKMT
jgi:hypothetical protein